MQPVWQQLLLILAAFLLVLLNGFFVAAEFAIVKVRATRMAELAEQGLWQARMAKRMLKHLDAYLSATQLGITIASLGLGWIGKPAVAHVLEPVFRWLGIESPAMVQATSFAVAFTLISFLHIVLGELAPKSLAIRKPEATSLWVAMPLVVFFYVMYPAIAALNATANALLKTLGLGLAGEGESAHSWAELRMIVAASHAHGSLDASETKLLENVIDFSERRVVEIMTPRAEMICLFTGKTLDENIAIVRKSQHTRFPLADGDVDSIIGLIHFKDLFLLQGPTDEGGVIRSITRPILALPQSATIDNVLKNFQRTRVLMGVVVDERGRVGGVVTLEDVLEEIVGPIRDEFDVQESPESARRGNDVFVDAQMPLRAAPALFPDIDWPADDSIHTIGGLVLKMFGRLPKTGESLTLGAYSVQVVEMDKQHIGRLCFRKTKMPLHPCSS